MSIRRKVSILAVFTAALVGALGAAGLFVVLSPLFTDAQKFHYLRYLLLGGGAMGSAVTIVVGAVVARSVGSRLRALEKPDHIPLRNDEVDGVAADLNDLRANVKALREKAVSEEQLLSARRYADNIIKSMFDILIVADPDLRIVTVNRAACDLLEYSEIELIGKPLDFVFKQESMTLGPSLRQIMLNTTTHDTEMTYIPASGRQITALVSVSMMRDPAGRPQAVITVGKDITQRKQVENELMEAKSAAEGASRAKSSFLANMSHEIRTPMTAILGYADLLSYPDQSDEQRHQCIQTIRRNSQHLLAIINDILDVSKIEAGKMTVEQIECSPVSILSDVHGLMIGRARDKNLALDVRFVDPVPERILSDPTRLRQILVNLLGNAIKFTNRGGVKLLVGIVPGGYYKSTMIRFDVVDTGVGMTDLQVSALFKPFTQADASTTRRFGGTGLGLTIARRLAQLLGGDINVRSVQGNGSTFTVTIRTGDLAGVRSVERFDAAYINDGANSSSWQGARARLNGRVLLAEDGPDNRTLIRFYLEQAGLQVEMVENGAEAVETALAAQQQGRPFDLILMDMQMPEMDGYEASSRLRAANYTRPIVALTAHAMDGDREKCLASGCDDFATKPIEPQRLLEVICQAAPNVAVAARPAPAPLHAQPAAPSTTSVMMTNPKLAKLVERFVNGLTQRIEAIQQALADEDRKQLRLLAHQLKGAAGGYGYPQLSQLAGSLEANIESEIPAITQCVQVLAEQCREAQSTRTATAG